MLATPPRWVWENNTGTAIARMMEEDYAYMNTLQAVYLELSIPAPLYPGPDPVL